MPRRRYPGGCGKVIHASPCWVALGVGVLAKGPVALVLVGVLMVAWSLVIRRWRELWPLSAVVRYNGKAWAYL